MSTQTVPTVAQMQLLRSMATQPTCELTINASEAWDLERAGYVLAGERRRGMIRCVLTDDGRAAMVEGCLTRARALGGIAGDLALEPTEDTPVALWREVMGKADAGDFDELADEMVEAFNEARQEARARHIRAGDEG